MDSPMSDPVEREFAVFSAARRLPPEERAAYLDEACAGDAVLRQQVENLLRAGEEAGVFLQQPAPGAQRPAHGGASPNLPPTVAAAGEKAGDRIGRYKLLQQIGEGGCGVVYMAEQQQPVRRRVALKVIKLGMDTKSVIARFEAERQALALMDHPNIAKVLEAGATDTGRPYFVMELVRGIKITDYCDQNGLSTEERLNLFLQVCQAIQHAHQKGIIHRDIKPSNILVTLHDGAPVSKVIDFGIAKATTGQRLTDMTLFTAFEQFIGTPAYMSPEQAEMSALDIDTRTDIYSLGVLLYELLTGKTPFDAKELVAAGLDAMRRTIREQEPARPSTRLGTMLVADLTEVARHRRAEPARLPRLIRGDLDWIVMKALEKDRARRYETANGLAMDVQRYLRDESVEASPPGRFYRLQKLVRRNKLVFGAAGAVTAALVIGLGASTFLFFRERESRRREAEKLYAAYLAQARANRLSNGPGRNFETLETIGKAAAMRPSLELRNEAIAALSLVDARLVGSGETNAPDAGKLVFDPTLETFARVSPEGDVSVRRLENGKEIGRVPSRQSGVNWLQGLSAGGRYLTFDTAQPKHCVWDVRKGEMVFRDLAAAGGLALNSTGDSLAILEPASVSLYNFDSREVSRHASQVSAGSAAMAMDLQGSRLACFNCQTEIAEIVELNSGDVKGTFSVPECCSAMQWSRDGQWLAGACRNTAYIWNAVTGELLQKCAGHDDRITRLAFNRAGTLLATTSWDDTLRLWDPFSGAQLLNFAGSSYQLQFSQDDGRLAFVVVQNTMGGSKFGLLEMAGSAQYRRLLPRVQSSEGGQLAVSPDNSFIAAIMRDRVRLWDQVSGKEIGALPTAHYSSVIFDSTGKSLITSGSSGLARWPLQTVPGKAVKTIRLGPRQELAAGGPGFMYAAMSADGRHIARGLESTGELRLLDSDEPGKEITLARHPGLRWLSISPGAEWVATGTRWGEGVRVWDIQSQRMIKELPEPGGSSVLFSPDGRWLLTAGAEYHLFETQSWHPGPRISVESKNLLVGVMAFSPDSQLLAIAYGRRAIRLLQTNTGQPLADFEAPSLSLVQGLCFNANGRQLLASDGLGQLHLWNLPSTRERLAALKLDWDLPAYLPQVEKLPLTPVRFEVIESEADTHGIQSAKPAR